jgi:hypothetical protein
MPDHLGRDACFSRRGGVPVSFRSHVHSPCAADVFAYLLKAALLNGPD